MRFSNRTSSDLSNNPLAAAMQRVGQSQVLDLTDSNPTKCGFEYPPEFLRSLNQPEALVYEPRSFGISKARQAVMDYLKSRGTETLVSNVVLTASTSEAYSYLFKLLGNSGDSILVPTPGYPLLEHLASLEEMETLRYPLRMSPGWPVDLEMTEKVLRPNTKALVVVNPNNPTGSFLSPEDQGALLNLCQKREIAYISDEVFGDFAYTKDISTIRPKSSVLSFRLGGLSKSLGLPQLKLSWMVVDGPPKLLSECLERLELIADTYLSVNTPVQLILEELLAFAPSIQHQIKTRILTNRSFLERHLDAVKGIKVWPGQGGWYALIEVLNPNETDEQLAIGLLEKHKVLVHPGRFYDFPKGCFLVLSLLAKPFVWEEGVTRLKEFLASKG